MKSTATPFDTPRNAGEALTIRLAVSADASELTRLAELAADPWQQVLGARRRAPHSRFSGTNWLAMNVAP
jgi:hypothetical protein